MNTNIKNVLFDIASAIVVIALALYFQPSETVVGIYWAAAFWILTGVDFYKSQVVEDGQSEVVAHLNPAASSVRTSLVNRILGYIFFAPFIAPARLLRMLIG